MNDLVHLRLDSDMREEMKKATEEYNFSSESEFIRDSIRKNLESYRKIELLKSLQNSLEEENVEGVASDIFREFGIE